MKTIPTLAASTLHGTEIDPDRQEQLLLASPYGALAAGRNVALNSSRQLALAKLWNPEPYFNNNTASCFSPRSSRSDHRVRVASGYSVVSALLNL